MLEHNRHCHFHKESQATVSLELSGVLSISDKKRQIIAPFFDLVKVRSCCVSVVMWIFVKMVNAAHCANRVSSLSFPNLTSFMSDVGLVLIFACPLSNVSIASHYTICARAIACTFSYPNYKIPASLLAEMFSLSASSDCRLFLSKCVQTHGAMSTIQ